MTTEPRTPEEALPQEDEMNEPSTWTPSYEEIEADIDWIREAGPNQCFLCLGRTAAVYIHEPECPTGDEAALRERLWDQRVAAGGLGPKNDLYHLGWDAGFGDAYEALQVELPEPAHKEVMKEARKPPQHPYRPALGFLGCRECGMQRDVHPNVPLDSREKPDD